MEYLKIRAYNEDIHVSQLGFGTANEIQRLSKEELFAMFDQVQETGGNLYDSAHDYLDGESERLLGEWIRLRNNRNHLVISTKGCHPLMKTMHINRLSAVDMEGDVNQSLTSLGVEVIDLYWIHRDDPSYPVETVVDNINRILIRPGKVRAVGACNWSISRIAAANEYAAKTGQAGFVMSQVQWSPVIKDQQGLSEVQATSMNPKAYSWYREKEMPVFSINLGAHIYSKAVCERNLDAIPPFFVKMYDTGENRARAGRLGEYAAKKGISVVEAYHSFMIHSSLKGIAIVDTGESLCLKEALSSGADDMTPDDARWIFRG
ncbi:MAG: aldo/keto reductase [Lachnospiraceae bacterium]|nr:aldo/keto reductase [Lachnospiraceae bacterium]